MISTEDPIEILLRFREKREIQQAYHEALRSYQNGKFIYETSIGVNNDGFRGLQREFDIAKITYETKYQALTGEKPW